MSFQVKWLIENHILFGITPDDYKFDDFIAMNKTMMDYLDKAPPDRLIHFIGDMRAAKVSPTLSEQRKLTFPTHPAFGWTVMYGLKMNPLAKMIMAIASQLFRARFREVDDFDAALDFLQSVDATLPDLTRYRNSAKL